MIVINKVRIVIVVVCDVRANAVVVAAIIVAVLMLLFAFILL